MNDEYKANESGATILVAKDGKILYRNAFGKSNLELGTDMIPENVFEIGSITKQFTAVGILMLLEEGKLSLDDEITKYIPDYPTQGATITIHHLLTHTSGIKSYTSLPSLRDLARKDITPTELIDAFKNEPMDFKPGEQYRYNNSGYVLLGYIIEKISGISYEDFIQKRIFDKLNMYGKIYVASKAKSKTFKKVALVSGWQAINDRIGLYLKETNRPLILVGNTKVQGKAYLPKRGVRAGTISGNSYYSNQLIYGTILKSTETLPKLPEKLISHDQIKIPYDDEFNGWVISIEKEAEKLVFEASHKDYKRTITMERYE